MRNVIARTAALLAFSASASFAQGALRFEVASVKTFDLGKLHGEVLRFEWGPSRLALQAVSLHWLIERAYAVDAFQVDAPEWTTIPAYELIANLPDGASVAQIPEMLRALLAERFKLAVHRENKEQSIVALVVSKDGLKLHEAAPDAGKSPTHPTDGRMLMTRGRTIDGRMWSRWALNRRTLFDAPSLTLNELAEQLRLFSDDPLIDQTGVKGYYEVELELPRLTNRAIARGVGSPQDGSASDPDGVSIFTSIKKLGLELQKRKAPIEHLVVDHVERVPTDN